MKNSVSETKRNVSVSPETSDRNDKNTAPAKKLAPESLNVSQKIHYKNIKSFPS